MASLSSRIVALKRVLKLKSMSQRKILDFHAFWEIVTEHDNWVENQIWYALLKSSRVSQVKSIQNFG